MIYVLTEWDGRGSGEISKVSQKAAEVFPFRRCTLTLKTAMYKHGRNYFCANDVKSSTIDCYTSEKKRKLGISKYTKQWY